MTSLLRSSSWQATFPAATLASPCCLSLLHCQLLITEGCHQVLLRCIQAAVAQSYMLCPHSCLCKAFKMLVTFYPLIWLLMNFQNVWGTVLGTTYSIVVVKDDCSTRPMWTLLCDQSHATRPLNSNCPFLHILCTCMRRWFFCQCHRHTRENEFPVLQPEGNPKTFWLLV